MTATLPSVGRTVTLHIYKFTILPVQNQYNSTIVVKGL